MILSAVSATDVEHSGGLFIDRDVESGTDRLSGLRASEVNPCHSATKIIRVLARNRNQLRNRPRMQGNPRLQSGTVDDSWAETSSYLFLTQRGRELVGWMPDRIDAEQHLGRMIRSQHVGQFCTLPS